MSIFRNAAVISAMTLLSRITGLIRDILIARVFGVSGDTDAYYVAFRLPNLLRRLFAEGVFPQPAQQEQPFLGEDGFFLQRGGDGLEGGVRGLFG